MVLHMSGLDTVPVRFSEEPSGGTLQVLRNQGVQASEWGDVAGVVAQSATRVLKTVMSPAPAPDTRSPKPETRNPKPKTRSPKPESRSPKPEARNPKPEARNPNRDALLLHTLADLPHQSIGGGEFIQTHLRRLSPLSKTTALTGN